ncbi:hypothetical protein CALVIDRAFT_421166 [Calocera viscosa TUFC12733]|uniref:Uncharacterized protein n=1 Tax=Calocera viscosa (strain TUFC12733) TaxID=1330018 RepID=A0A167PI38_CALVF|nr:hypothetical protein CALVIDRAFT_421166 [Calocera viscosa TUFC12733]
MQESPAPHQHASSAQTHITRRSTSQKNWSPSSSPSVSIPISLPRPSPSHSELRPLHFWHLRRERTTGLILSDSSRVGKGRSHALGMLRHADTTLSRDPHSHTHTFTHSLMHSCTRFRILTTPALRTSVSLYLSLYMPHLGSRSVLSLIVDGGGRGGKEWDLEFARYNLEGMWLCHGYIMPQRMYGPDGPQGFPGYKLQASFYSLQGSGNLKWR